MSDAIPAPDAHTSHGSPGRRNFLAEFAAIVIGGIVSIVPLIPGVAFFLDPILRKRSGDSGGADGFLRVANMAELPDDGTPLRFTLQADRFDAWNKFQNQTVGTVYLRKITAATPVTVLAFNDTCPHLGCKVDYKPSDKTFFCPCHASSFDMEGARTNKIPPRGLDVLDVKTDDDGTVWVKYANFRRGIAEKVQT